MSDSYDRMRFNMIIRELEEEDPEFARHMRDLPTSQGRRRRRWAWLLWAVAPLLIMVGGWTGLLLAVIGTGVGMLLMWRPTVLFRNVTPRRPGTV